MTLPTSPTVPNPSNMATFDSLAYPFAKWIKSVASITDTSLVFGAPLKKQTFFTLQNTRLDVLDMGGTFTPSFGKVYYIPLFVRSDIKITDLCVYVISGGGNMKMSLCSDLNGFPNALIAKTASFAVPTAGWKTIPIVETTLYAGNLYWCGFTRDGSYGVYAEYSTDNFSIVLGNTFSDPQMTVSSSCLGIAETYANAFTTFTGFTRNSTSPYIIQKGTLL